MLTPGRGRSVREDNEAPPGAEAAGYQSGTWLLGLIAARCLPYIHRARGSRLCLVTVASHATWFVLPIAARALT
jgi:hypothetical protein